MHNKQFHYPYSELLASLNLSAILDKLESCKEVSRLVELEDLLPSVILSLSLEFVYGDLDLELFFLWNTVLLPEISSLKNVRIIIILTQCSAFLVSMCNNS